MKLLNETLKKVEEYAVSFLLNDKPPLKTYHNLFHTQQVVKACVEMALFYSLIDEEYFIVTTAGWFHDIGYFDGAYKHEERGAAKAAEFLKQEGITNTIIEAVKNCIFSTKLPQVPKNLLDEIICDADLFHLGSKDFETRSELMKEELEGTLRKKINAKDWKEGTLRLLEEHHYFTSYANEMLGDQKNRNILKLKNEIEAFNGKISPTNSL